MTVLDRAKARVHERDAATVGLTVEEWRANPVQFVPMSRAEMAGAQLSGFAPFDVIENVGEWLSGKADAIISVGPGAIFPSMLQVLHVGMLLQQEMDRAEAPPGERRPPAPGTLYPPNPDEPPRYVQEAVVVLGLVVAGLFGGYR